MKKDPCRSNPLDWRIPSKIIRLPVAAIMAYGLSLLCPALYTTFTWPGEYSALNQSGETWYGYEILQWGWLVVFPSRGIEYWSIAWYANPLFFLTFSLIINKSSSSATAAYIGFFVAITSLAYTKIWNDKEPPTLVISGYGPGFYLWIIAFILLIIAAHNLDKKHQAV